VDDRRTFERHCLWFPITIDAATGQVFAVCRDASARGVLVSGSAALAIGDTVTLSFRLSPNDESERKVEGRIVRTLARDSDPRNMWPHRMAVEFAEPVPELQQQLEHVSTHPPPNSGDGPRRS
jgi:hypothetical protein